MSKDNEYLDCINKAVIAFKKYDSLMKRGKATKHEGDRLHCFQQAQKDLEWYFNFCDKAFEASLAISPIKQS